MDVRRYSIGVTHLRTITDQWSWVPIIRQNLQPVVCSHVMVTCPYDWKDSSGQKSSDKYRLSIVLNFLFVYSIQISYEWNTNMYNSIYLTQQYIVFIPLNMTRKENWLGKVYSVQFVIDYIMDALNGCCWEVLVHLYIKPLE